MTRVPRQLARLGAPFASLAEVDAYTGPSGEAIFDGTRLRVHNGSTTGGIALARQVDVAGVASDLSALSGQVLGGILMKDLATTSIPAVQVAVRPAGWHAAGDGAQEAVYVPSATQSAGVGRRQSQDGRWWEPRASVYVPEMFGAVANGNSSARTSDSPAINEMFEYVPEGSQCLFQAKYYFIGPTISTNYGIRLRRSLKVMTAGARLVNDNSMPSTSDTVLIQPPGTSLNVYTLHFAAFCGFRVVPFAASLGYVVEVDAATWTVGAEYNSYGRDAIRIDVPAGTGMGNFVFVDNYTWSAGGWGINYNCDPASSGVFTSVADRNKTYGGFRASYTADSNDWGHITLKGKTGLDTRIANGAVRNRVGVVNCVTYGPAIRHRWGGHIEFDQFNVEQHDNPLNAGLRSDNHAILDFACDASDANTSECSGIVIRSLTVGCQIAGSTSNVGGIDRLVYVGKTLNFIVENAELYSGNSTPDGIYLSSTARYSRMKGPFTRQDPTTTGVLNLVNDNGVGTYGVEKTSPASWGLVSGSNYIASLPQNPFSYTKDNNGYVALTGVVAPTTSAAISAGQVLLTLPVGFRPKYVKVFIVTGEGALTIRLYVTPSGDVTLYDTAGSSSGNYMEGIRFKDAGHDALASCG